MLPSLNNGLRSIKDMYWRADSLLLRMTGRGKIKDPIADQIERGEEERKPNPEFMVFKRELFQRLDLMNTLIMALVNSEAGTKIDQLSNQEEVVDKKSRQAGVGAGFGLAALALGAKSAIEGALKGLINGLKKAFGKIKSLGKLAIDFMKGLRRRFMEAFKSIQKIVPKITKASFFTKLLKPANKIAGIGARITGGVIGKLGNNAVKFFKILKAAGKTIPLLGTLAIAMSEVIESNNEIKNLITLKDEGRISESEFKQRVAESITGAAIDTAATAFGATVGAAVLGTLFSAVPVVGTIIGAVAGGAAGAVVGQWVSETFLKPIMAPVFAKVMLGGYEEIDNLVKSIGGNLDSVVKALDPGNVIDATIGQINPGVAKTIHAAMEGIGNNPVFAGSPSFTAPSGQSQAPANRASTSAVQKPPSSGGRAQQISMSDPVGGDQTAIIINNQMNVFKTTRVINS